MYQKVPKPEHRSITVDMSCGRCDVRVLRRRPARIGEPNPLCGSTGLSWRTFEFKTGCSGPRTRKETMVGFFKGFESVPVLSLRQRFVAAENTRKGFYVVDCRTKRTCRVLHGFCVESKVVTFKEFLYIREHSKRFGRVAKRTTQNTRWRTFCYM